MSTSHHWLRPSARVILPQTQPIYNSCRGCVYARIKLWRKINRQFLTLSMTAKKTSKISSSLNQTMESTKLPRGYQRSKTSGSGHFLNCISSVKCLRGMGCWIPPRVIGTTSCNIWTCWLMCAWAGIALLWVISQKICLWEPSNSSCRRKSFAISYSISHSYDWSITHLWRQKYLRRLVG